MQRLNLLFEFRPVLVLISGKVCSKVFSSLVPCRFFCSCGWHEHSSRVHHVGRSNARLWGCTSLCESGPCTLSSGRSFLGRNTVPMTLLWGKSSYWNLGIIGEFDINSHLFMFFASPASCAAVRFIFNWSTIRAVSIYRFVRFKCQFNTRISSFPSTYLFVLSK